MNQKDKSKIDLYPELKEFLVKGKMADNQCWNNQFKFFIISVFFILCQLFRSFVVPAMSTVFLLCMILVCKKKEKKKYANVYNTFYQSVTWVIIWLVNGCCFVSLFLNNWIKTTMFCCALVFLYSLLIMWRFLVVKKKILQNWYKSLSQKISVGLTTVFVVFGVLLGRTIGMSLRNMHLNNDTVFLLLGVLFFTLSLVFIFLVDIGMRCYYFSRLSEEDKKIVIESKVQ